MSLSDEMKQALLDYFAKGDSNARSFQSLTTIFEKVIRSTRWRDTFFNDIEGVDDEEHLRTILDQMVIDGQLERDWGERDYEGSYRAVKDVGINHLTTANVATGRSEVSSPMLGLGMLKHPDPPSSLISSSSWTGLPSQFVLDEQKKAELVLLLAAAERTLDSLGMGNSEKATVRAYIIAARALSDVPDPPVDIIWELINRANSLAGIAALFVSIIALFTSAAR